MTDYAPTCWRCCEAKDDVAVHGAGFVCVECRGLMRDETVRIHNDIREQRSRHNAILELDGQRYNRDHNLTTHEQRVNAEAFMQEAEIRLARLEVRGVFTAAENETYERKLLGGRTVAERCVPTPDERAFYAARAERIARGKARVEAGRAQLSDNARKTAMGDAVMSAQARQGWDTRDRNGNGRTQGFALRDEAPECGWLPL